MNNTAVETNENHHGIMVEHVYLTDLEAAAHAVVNTRMGRVVSSPEAHAQGPV